MASSTQDNNGASLSVADAHPLNMQHWPQKALDVVNKRVQQPQNPSNSRTNHIVPVVCHFLTRDEFATLILSLLIAHQVANENTSIEPTEDSQQTKQSTNALWTDISNLMTTRRKNGRKNHRRWFSSESFMIHRISYSIEKMRAKEEKNFDSTTTIAITDSGLCLQRLSSIQQRFDSLLSKPQNSITTHKPDEIKQYSREKLFLWVANQAIYATQVGATAENKDKLEKELIAVTRARYHNGKNGNRNCLFGQFYQVSFHSQFSRKVQRQLRTFNISDEQHKKAEELICVLSIQMQQPIESSNATATNMPEHTEQQSLYCPR